MHGINFILNYTFSVMQAHSNIFSFHLHSLLPTKAGYIYMDGKLVEKVFGDCYWVHFDSLIEAFYAKRKIHHVGILLCNRTTF